MSALKKTYNTAATLPLKAKTIKISHDLQAKRKDKRL